MAQGAGAGEESEMTKGYPSYNLLSNDADVDEYMERQPRVMAIFERHAEVETALFKESGLMCRCEEPAISQQLSANSYCATCKLPLYRLTVLAAEKQVNDE